MAKPKQEPPEASGRSVQPYRAYAVGVLKQDDPRQRQGKKGDGVRSNALDPDDEFAPFTKEVTRRGIDLLNPPYNPLVLASYAQRNNALGPCVDAMETNVDGTGHVIKDREVPQDDEEAEDAGSEDEEDGDGTDFEKEERRRNVEQFFDEVFPGMSFLTLRRKLRRDLELTGNAYIEFIRNLEGELLFLRHVRAKDVRLVKLDDPVEVPVKVMRGGAEVSVDMWLSERRYAQRIGTKLVYFKQYGASRELNRETGEWATPEKPVGSTERASEIYHFTLQPDTVTPYGVPRWVGQTPSVVGSRKAEELNLEYFKSGGVPPFIITIAGGRLGEEMQRTVDNILTGQAQGKQRGFVIEAEPLGSGVTDTTPVKMEVHRFGAEQVKDSLFENYDARAEKRVRRSFRLPPLFVGQSEDFSFATAFASYTVAEAQVFRPERIEFDEFVNMILMPELDQAGEFEFESLPIAVHDIATKLEAIGLAREVGADDEDVLEAINETSGLDLMMGEEDEEDEEEFPPLLQPIATANQNAPEGQPQPGQPPQPGAPASAPREVRKGAHGRYRKRRRRARKSRGRRVKAEELVALVQSARGLMQLRAYDESDAQALVSVVERVRQLQPQDRSNFHHLLAMTQFDDVSHDPEGLAKLAGCSLEALAAQVASATKH